MKDKVERDARWWRWKYKYQNMLSIDRIYMESITEEREGVGNGVKQESSLPFVLLELACQMADIECEKSLTKPIEAYHKWSTYTEHPLVIELRSTDAKQEARKQKEIQGMRPTLIIYDDIVDYNKNTMGLPKRTEWVKPSETKVVHESEINLEKIQTPFIAPELVNDISKYEVQKVSKREYIHHLNKLTPDLRAMLNDDIQADNYYVVVNWVDVVIGGFGTNANGYLTGLFSLIKRHGNQIFKMRMEQAKLDKDGHIEYYTLFCIGSKLENFYYKQGFQVKSTTEWDHSYAQKNWNYARFGTPNLYRMWKKI